MAPTSRYFPTTKLLLVVADVTCIVAATAASLALWLGGAVALQTTSAMLVPLLLIAFAFVLVAYGCGLYDDNRLRSARAALAPAAIAVAIAAVMAKVLGEALASPAGAAFLVVPPLALLCVVLIRTLRAAAAARGLIGTPCVVVGSAASASGVAALVARYPHAEISILGVVQPSGSWRPEELVGDLPILGTAASLEEVVRANRVSLVVLAAPPRHYDSELLRTLRLLRYSGVKVTDFTGLHEELAREIPLDHLNDEWLFLASTANSRLHARYMKRVMDLVGAALLLVPASFVVGIAALAVRLTSEGPVVFRQERLGLGSRPFMVLKLRTMYEDAEKRGAMWSTDNDPRITPVGRVLRKFRIDELPQLVNVLRGEMSLVGPRPERPVFTDKISMIVPLFPERLMVKPGITGWAQVMAPYAASIEDSQKKLQFDLYYAKHMSPGLDLLIAAKTVRTMVFGRERNQGGMVAGKQIAPIERASA